MISERVYELFYDLWASEGMDLYLITADYLRLNAISRMENIIFGNKRTVE